MKKILFCLQTMILGGVEKELITILKQMSPDEYDISLLVLYVSDETIMKQIPEYVRIINLDIDKDYYCSTCSSLCRQRIKRGKYFEASALMLKRTLGIGMTHANTNISCIPPCEEQYDIAICYHVHSPLTLRYVSEKTKAKKKIAWIHNDFSTTGFHIEKLKKQLNAYHEIIAVSHKVEKEFLELCPKYKEKLFTCYNVVDENEIVQKSGEDIDNPLYAHEKSPKLLTIGRFTSQKGFDIAIKAAEKLKMDKVDFKWFFIGAGEQESQYIQLIKECDVEDRVTILGRIDNPYPYIRNCDIYIQPSRHEAYGLVVHEARVLHRPIICSNFAGSEEQIVSGVNGMIVPLEDVDRLYSAIKTLLNDSILRENFVKALEVNSGNMNEFFEIEKHFKN